jgi:hypothetical protein
MKRILFFLIVVPTLLAAQTKVEWYTPKGTDSAKTYGGKLVPQNLVKGLPEALDSMAATKGTTVLTVASSTSLQKAHADFICDGIEDQIQIQAALDSVWDNGGGTVKLLEGIFNVAYYPTTVLVSLRIPNNVTLEGSGINATTIKRAANQSTGQFLISNKDTVTAHNVVIKDLTIDGNKANNRGGTTFVQYGIGFGGNLKYAIVENVLAQNMRGQRPDGVSESAGFQTVNTAHVSFINCISVGCDSSVSGFSADASTDIRWINCTSYNQGLGIGFTHNNIRNGIYIGCVAYGDSVCGFNSEFSDNISYVNCLAGISSADYDGGYPADSAMGNGLAGFNVYGGKKNISFVNCMAKNNKDGLAVNQSKYINIIGGAYSNNTRYGIHTSQMFDSIYISGSPYVVGNDTAVFFQGSSMGDTLVFQDATAPNMSGQSILKSYGDVARPQLELRGTNSNKWFLRNNTADGTFNLDFLNPVDAMTLTTVMQITTNPRENTIKLRGSIYPSSNLMYNLGKLSLQYDTLFINKIFIGSTTIQSGFIHIANGNDGEISTSDAYSLKFMAATASGTMGKGVIIQGYGSGGWVNTIQVLNNSSGTVNAVLVPESGTVGIGLETGIDSMLTVNLGGWFKRGLRLDDNAIIGGTAQAKAIYGTDTMKAGTKTGLVYSYFIPGGALVQSSSSALKTNIQNYTADLSKFKLVSPRKFNFKKELFLDQFNEKSVPDSVGVQIHHKLRIPSVDKKGKLTFKDSDSVSVKMVSNEIAKNNARTDFYFRNNVDAERRSKIEYRGFLAEEFNGQLFGKESKEINNADVINTLWLKVQELEKRIELLEAKK